MKVFSGDFWFRPVPAWRYDLVRIGFSVAALLTLVELWPYRLILLSDEGMNSLDAVLASSEHLSFSIFVFLTSPTAVTLSFLLAFAAGLCLLLGIAPRCAVAILYLWFLSFLARTQIAAVGYDYILSNFALLLLVSPLGQRSLPRGRRAPQMAPRYGLLLMRLQVYVIYWQTVLNRLDDEFWTNGDFLYYFLQSTYSRFTGEWLIDAAPTLRFFTWLIQAAEIALPLLLSFRRTMWIGFALGALLHLSIFLGGQHLLFFSLTMIMTYLSFVREAPPFFSGAFGRLRGPRASDPAAS